MDSRQIYSKPEAELFEIRFEGRFLQQSQYNAHGNQRLKVFDEEVEFGD